jgi:hypothetical protein
MDDTNIASEPSEPRELIEPLAYAEMNERLTQIMKCLNGILITDGLALATRLIMVLIITCPKSSRANMLKVAQEVMDSELVMFNQNEQRQGMIENLANFDVAGHA